MTVDLTVVGFGERNFTGRIERINQATEPGTLAIFVFVGIPNNNRDLRGGALLDCDAGFRNGVPEGGVQGGTAHAPTRSCPDRRLDVAAGVEVADPV